jgi:hypothetical protein
MGGNNVAATPAGKVFDDAGIGIGDGENGNRRPNGKECGEVDVIPERPECLLGTVGRGGEPVGTQPDPREDRDQGNLVKDGGIFQASRSSDDEMSQPCEGRFVSSRVRLRFLRIPSPDSSVVWRQSQRTFTFRKSQSVRIIRLTVARARRNGQVSPWGEKEPR